LNSLNNLGIIAVTITVTGRVQGVGFRPFVFRIATGLRLAGWVLNTNEGVIIRLEGEQEVIHAFLRDLHGKAPEASLIRSIQSEETTPEMLTEFNIRKSVNLSDETTEISPDIAVCRECLADMEKQVHRIDYPLINCTNCGPRFTIIKDLPYDRSLTTMDVFPMCSVCKGEYEDILDRRFHAQPVACNECGPQYELWKNGKRLSDRVPEIVSLASGVIQKGEILAIKGVGGFHLACHAFDHEAVMALRRRKGRETKPLAVMFRNPEAASAYVKISPLERESLTSWRRPILLLQTKSHASPSLSPALNEGLSTLGVMLPYMPFHYLLMRELKSDAIVLTSGNYSDDPILIDNQTVLDDFKEVADIVITHQRAIYNRVDDSVVRVMAGKPRVFRRARGYCPDPVLVSQDVSGILAMGAELVNSFCIGKGHQAYMSQHIGDLKNPATQLFYRETVDRFASLYRTEPEVIVTDLHPEYSSSKTGLVLMEELTLQGRDIHLEHVQHHHAHIASCMAEHGLDEQVIGISFDGTGLGSDGHIWGSEFFRADLSRFERISHLAYLPMPGGDKAVKEPWRMALSCLFHAFGEDLTTMKFPFLEQVGQERIAWILQMIRQQVNMPLTCGAGRYFDAVSALLGLCFHAGYEGEGPMKLESLIRSGIPESYLFEPGSEISFARVFRAIVKDIRDGVDREIIATKFHNSIISAIFDTVSGISRQYGIRKVVLSGGVFQNRYLVENLQKRLKESKFNVYMHAAVPPNDGGVALGQLVVAAKRRSNYVSGRTC